MLRRCIVVLICLATGACSTVQIMDTVAPAKAGFRVVRYHGGLEFPIDMAWVRGTKKIFFTEKNTGKVRVMIAGRLLSRPCVNLSVDGAGEELDGAIFAALLTP